ncbi:MAG: efflux RND transporter periplasmic adaptor subunit [Maribacter sp.]
MIKIVVCSFLFILNVYAQTIYATFDVVALKSANVAFTSGGIVDKLYVEIGEQVKKDDTLATLQNDDIEALLNIHTTTLQYAKKDYDRQVQIKKIIDKQKFDSYEQVYKSAQAQVKYQKALLDKTILKAPFDAVVISKELEIGDVVSGQMIKTVFQLQSIHERKLILQFDQKYHNDVNVGDIFTYKIDGDTKEYQGIISKIYPFADIKTRKVKAEVITNDIMVGLFGDGYITAKSKVE